MSLKRKQSFESVANEKKKKPNSYDGMDTIEDCEGVVVLSLDITIGSNLLTSKVKDVKENNYFAEFFETLETIKTEKKAQEMVESYNFDFIKDKHYLYLGSKAVDRRVQKPTMFIFIAKLLKLWNYKLFVQDQVRINGLNLQYASLEMTEDPTVVLEAFDQNTKALDYASNKLKHNKVFIQQLAQRNGRKALQFASEKLRSDIDIAMTVAREDIEMLYDFAATLRGNKAFIQMLAQEYLYEAMRFASSTLQKDPELILYAVSKRGAYLKEISHYLKTLIEDGQLEQCREIVQAAIKQKGNSLQYAPEYFRNDKEIVLEAISQDGKNLEFASPELKKDREVVKLAVEKNWESLPFASKELRQDKDLILLAAQQSPAALEFAPNKLRNNKRFVMAVARRFGISALEFASEKLQNDREVVMTAVKQSGEALSVASENLQNDREIAAVSKNQRPKRNCRMKKK